MGLDPTNYKERDYRRIFIEHDIETKLQPSVVFIPEGNCADIIKNYREEILDFFKKGRSVQIDFKLNLYDVRGFARVRLGINDISTGNRLNAILARNLLDASIGGDNAVEFFADTIYAKYSKQTFLEEADVEVTCTTREPDDISEHVTDNFCIKGSMYMKPTMPGATYNRLNTSCNETDYDQLTKTIRKSQGSKITLTYNGYGQGWHAWPSGSSWTLYIRMFLYCPELFDIYWDNQNGLTMTSRKCFRDEQDILGDISLSFKGIRVTNKEEVQTILPIAMHPFNPEYKYTCADETSSGSFSNQDPDKNVFVMFKTTMGNTLTVEYKKEIYDPLKIFNECGELEQKCLGMANHFKYMKEEAQRIMDSGKSLVQIGKEEIKEIIRKDPIRYSNSDKYGKLSELANLYLNSTDEDVADEEQ